MVKVMYLLTVNISKISTNKANIASAIEYKVAYGFLISTYNVLFNGRSFTKLLIPLNKTECLKTKFVIFFNECDCVSKRKNNTRYSNTAAE